MPQLNKGGKFVFGLSIIGNQNRIQIPTQALTKYKMTREGKIIIFTGAKVTGGFCVTNLSCICIPCYTLSAIFAPCDI